MSSRKSFSIRLFFQNRVPYLVLAFLCCVLYGNTLLNSYNLDDWLVTTDKNELVKQGVKAIPEIFTTHYFEWNDYKVDYRPLVKASFALEYELVGFNPAVSHFVNMVLYCATCLLLLSLLLRIFPNEKQWVLFIAILLFTVHPVHTEVVASLKNRDELLSFLFMLLAFHFVLLWSVKEKWVYLLISTVCIYASLISKMSAMPWIGIIGFVLLFIRKESVRKVVGVSVIMGATVVIHVLVVKFLLGAAVRDLIFIEAPFFRLDDASLKWPSIISSAGYYLKLLVLPVSLCSYYGFDEIPVTSWANWKVFASIIGYSAIVIVGFKGLFKPSVITVGAIILLLDIFPFLNIVYPYTGIVGERVLYGGTIGFTLMVSGILAHYAKDNEGYLNQSIPRSKPVVVFILGLLLLGSARTITRNLEWRDHLSLLAADSKNCSRSAKLHELYGAFLRDDYNENDSDNWKKQAYQAIAEYKKSIEIYEKWPIPHHRIGVIYHYDLKLPDSAIAHYEQAILLNPDFIVAREDLGESLMVLKRYSVAANTFEALISVDASDFDYWNRTSAAYFLASDLQNAKRVSSSFIKRFPKREEPYIHQGNILLASGDTAKALVYFERAIEINPSNKALQSFLKQLSK